MAGWLQRLSVWTERALEGASRAVASFSERTSRHRSHFEIERRSANRGVNRRGVGDRVMSSVMRGAAGYAWPGAWSADRLEMVKHLRHWTAVAIFRICNKVASLSPNVAYVHTDPPPRNAHPHRAYQRALYGDWRYKKTMHAVKPHETVEPANADHPLVRLFARPNAWDTAGQLWYELTMYLKLTGNGYLWVVPNRLGKPCELWVLPSHWVWPRWTPAGVRFYEIRPWVGPGILHIPEEEIIHIPYKSPIHKVDGWSPLSSGAEWIDVTEAIVQAWYWSFQNGAFPWGAIALGENYADPDEQQLDEIYARYVAKYQGVVNAGQPFIMPPGAKFQPLQINPTEMAFGESSERCRDNVLALFGVPKEVAGIQDAGSEIAMYGPMMQFVENAVAPELRLFGDVLTQFLARRWDDHLRVWWNNPVPDNPEQINKDLSLDMQYGLRTLNEARAIRGLETIDEPLADELLVSPKLVPLSQLGAAQQLGGPVGGIPPALPTPGQEGVSGAEGEGVPPGDNNDPFTNGTYGPPSLGGDGADQERQAPRFTLAMNGKGHRKGHRNGKHRQKSDRDWPGDCPRDEHGYCKPQGQGDDTGRDKPAAKPARRPDKPARKPAAEDVDRTRRPDEQPAEDADRTRHPEGNPRTGQAQKNPRDPILSLAAAGLDLPQHGPLAKDTSPLGQTLAEGKLVHAKPIAEGCNQATLMKLEGGQFGVYKSQAGEGVDTRTGSYQSLRKGVPLGTQYLREVAAYRLAVLAGMDDLVPLTTFRNQGGEAGSIQEYVDAARSAKESSDPYDGTKDAARAAAFDYLLGHMDRHSGNWLVTDEGKLALIDNGLSLPTAYHAEDFFNCRLWSHAEAAGLPLPNLSGLQEHWPAIEEVLKGCGIEDEAIALTKERFGVLTSGQYKMIGDLPDLAHPGSSLSETIAAANERLQAVMALWERDQKERERAQREALAQLPTNKEPVGVP